MTAVLVYFTEKHLDANFDCSTLFGVTKSEFVMVLLYASQKAEWPEACDNLLDKLIDQLFMTEQGLNFSASSENAYLMQAYKSTFMPDLYVQSLVKALNEKPID